MSLSDNEWWLLPPKQKNNRYVILEEIAETSLEFTNLWTERSDGCYRSNGTVGDFKRLHKRMKELEKELPNV